MDAGRQIGNAVFPQVPALKLAAANVQEAQIVTIVPTATLRAPETQSVSIKYAHQCVLAMPTAHHPMSAM